MTAWTEIADTDIDQDSPVIEPLMIAYRNNTRAAAEGSADAPVLSTGWHPYDMVDVGDGADGEIYDFSTDGTVSTITSPDFEDGYEYAFLFESISTATLGPLYLQMFRSVDGNFHSTVTIAAGLDAGKAYTGMFRMILPRLAKFHHQIEWMTVLGDDATSTTQTTTDMIHFDATQQKIDKARFSAAGDFDGGRILMLRRREFITG